MNIIVGFPFYFIYQKLAALIAALVLLVVSCDEMNIGSPEGAEIIDQHRYVLFEYDVTSQGVTNDGEYFYFSGSTNMSKACMKNGRIFITSTNAIPEELEEKGCNHIGGLSYYNGYIYAAIEDGPDYNNSFIALYDAETLEYTGIYYEVPHELHLEGVPWCAVDVERGYLYTAEWTNATVLNVFDLETLELVKLVPLSQPIDRIQGAEIFDGILYMSCDEENDMKRIFTLNPDTGVVEECFRRNIGKQFEAEGLTVFADENGDPVICVLDRGERRASVNLTYYRIAE